jgi:hypothetical protein
LCGRQLALAYQESQTATWADEVRCHRQDRLEALYRTQGDYGERRASQGFGAYGLYIDVCQCKSAGDFFEECGFLLV